MALRHQTQSNIFVIALYLQKKLFNAHNATPATHTASANLEALPANHYTNAMIAKSRSIILNATKLSYLSFTLTSAICHGYICLY